MKMIHVTDPDDIETSDGKHLDDAELDEFFKAYLRSREEEDSFVFLNPYRNVWINIDQISSWYYIDGGTLVQMTEGKKWMLVEDEKEFLHILMNDVLEVGI